MTYLKDLGFSNEVIDIIEENFSKGSLEALTEEKENVLQNINYLRELGVSNYIDAFIKFYNMFLLDNKTFDSIFSKYDKDDLVAKLEKNIAIMEYL